MKRFIVYPVILCLLSILNACYLFTSDYDTMLDGLYAKTVPLIFADSLKTLLLTEEKPIILDTRAETEYEVSHLPEAVCVGYTDFSLEKYSRLLSDNKPIVVYCAVGYRSERIGEKLLKAGKKRVYNLYGGIFQWVNEGNPIVNRQNLPTDSIHAYNSRWGKWLQKGTKVYD